MPDGALFAMAMQVRARATALRAGAEMLRRCRRRKRQVSEVAAPTVDGTARSRYARFDALATFAPGLVGLFLAAGFVEPAARRAGGDAHARPAMRRTPDNSVTRPRSR